MHPQRDDEAAIAAAGDRDVTKYADYLHGQVEELLTQFGRIDYLWFDFSYPQRVWGGKGREDWRSDELLAKARELQPDVIVNDRLDIPGDLSTPEQYQPAAPLAGDEGLWEACQTLNGSWGYDRDNLDWKPVDMLVRMLVDGVSKGGNLLLNVGPNARGQLEPRAVSVLEAHGRVDFTARPLHLRGRPLRAGSASRLPFHPGRGPAVRALVRLALRPPTPPRYGRPGRVRTAPARRFRNPHGGDRPSRAGAKHQAGRYRRGHAHPQVARPTPGRRRPRHRAISSGAGRALIPIGGDFLFARL